MNWLDIILRWNYNKNIYEIGEECMKCFIHADREAAAVCKKCGKAMCADCSAYSGHTGICPACRREEFVRERNTLEQEERDYVLAMIGWSLFTAALIWILVGLYGAYRIYRKVKRQKWIRERVAYLNGEITKIDRALTAGRAEI